MFGIKGKLVPRYIGPFLVLVRLGNVAYHFELPPALAGVYNVFHVFQLKKCLKLSWMSLSTMSRPSMSTCLIQSIQ
jgi:hypothetical protein